MMDVIRHEIQVDGLFHITSIKAEDDYTKADEYHFSHARSIECFELKKS